MWIAVDRETVKLSRYTFANNGTEEAYGSRAIETYQAKYGELASSSYGNTSAKNIQAFETSVTSHGGYYIARYEASYGTDGKPNSQVSTGTPNDNDGEEYVPTQEGQLWNNVTQSSAADACQNMYDRNYGITSDLVNSYAWDTAIIFIQKYSGDTDYSIQTSLNTALANTGTNGDQKCHIHDMASNLGEWTTETDIGTNGPCVARGGCYYRSGNRASLRLSSSADEASRYVTFRAILYL